MLLEDIDWAIEVISANKLYSGSLDNIKFNKERTEIKAWIDLINLDAVPISEEEKERLDEYEERYKQQSQKKGRKKFIIPKVPIDADKANADESKVGLIAGDPKKA